MSKSKPRKLAMNILLIILFGIALVAYIVIAILCVKRSFEVRSLSPRVFYTTASVVSVSTFLIVFSFYFLIKAL